MACGAWIETCSPSHPLRPRPCSPRMACGAWIETGGDGKDQPVETRSPRMACGAWIETDSYGFKWMQESVRPAWRAGRGLKRYRLELAIARSRFAPHGVRGVD